MRLYHEDAYDFANPVPSYWEATATPLSFSPERCVSAREADVAIIGAGYAGLSAALALARDYGVKTVVLEAGRPGWGASGRNGGFCSAAAAKLPYDTMIRRYGLAETRAFHRALRDSVAHVRDFLATSGVDAQATPDGDLRLAHRASRVDALHEEAAFMNATFGLDQQILTREELIERGNAGPHFHAGLLDPEAFGLHPLNYLRGLAGAAAQAGAILTADSPVTGWRRQGGRHVLTCPQGELTANRVILATNGYTPEDVAPWIGGRLMPALSRILVTRPLTEAERDAQGWTNVMPAHDTRDLLHYFRLLPDGRFLFGGRGGTDASPSGMARSQRALRAAFENLFPAWAHVGTAYAWSGLVCLTRPLIPHAGPLGDIESAFGAFAWHGNGVAMSGYTGRLVARLVAGERDGVDAIPAIMRRPLPRFPLPAFRRSLLRAIYALAGFRDNRD